MPYPTAASLSRDRVGLVRIRAAVELLKPITWFPPMWAFACGYLSAGLPLDEHAGRAVLGAILAGPLLCGSSQVVNDWFDRHVDALNEPDRPIPSGRMPGRGGLFLAIGWSVLSMFAAWAFGPTVFAASALGMALAWAYSAPPFRLKRNGWAGNSAVAIAYEGLAWLTGVSVALGGGAPAGPTVAFALLYSAGTHGIMTLNDFKSIEGDRRMGIGSLPVRLGPERAARLACGVMLVPQLVVIGILVALARPLHAAVVSLLALLQVACMPRLLAAPREQATWYSATGVGLFVSGMLVAALALR
ncbi:MAG: chlorophyll synthase ChlG [Myxococcota bacterium]